MHRTTATRPGRPDRPPIPSPSMIFPSRRGTIRGPRATHHEGAVRLRSSTRCQSPRLTWSSGSRCWTPALLTRTPPAVLQEQGVELLMALGEVPGREGDQRRQGEPEDPDRREVGHSTAVRGGAEPADPSLGLIPRDELHGQGTGAAAMARIQPQQLLRRGRGDQRRGVVRQRRSGTVTAMIWTPSTRPWSRLTRSASRRCRTSCSRCWPPCPSERPAWSAAVRADRRPAPQPRGDRPAYGVTRESHALTKLRHAAYVRTLHDYLV
jgi:hypothetical protein